MSYYVDLFDHGQLNGPLRCQRTGVRFEVDMIDTRQHLAAGHTDSKHSITRASDSGIHFCNSAFNVQEL